MQYCGLGTVWYRILVIQISGFVNELAPPHWALMRIERCQRWSWRQWQGLSLQPLGMQMSSFCKNSLADFCCIIFERLEIVENIVLPLSRSTRFLHRPGTSLLQATKGVGMPIDRLSATSLLSCARSQFCPG